MKSLLLLLILATFGYSIIFNGYANEEYDNISFTDSMMITSHRRLHQAAPGSVQGGNSTDTANTDVTYRYNYQYDSTAGEIYPSSGNVILLDTLQRVVKIQQGNIKTSFFEYGENTLSITMHPNDPVLSEASRHYIYTYRPDGQIASLVTIPTDWEYLQPPFWDTAHADTLTYSYNEEGQKTGAFYSSYHIDWSHGFPWKRQTDSLSYTYADLADGYQQAITQLTLVSRNVLVPQDPSDTTPPSYTVEKEWVSKTGDTLWLKTYDSDGLLTQMDKRRYDHQNSQWDQAYFDIYKYTYTDDNRIKESTQTLHYGDGTTTLKKWHDLYTYGENTIIYGGATAIGAAPTVAPQSLAYTYQNRKLQLSGSQPFNGIAIYSIQGRKLRENFNQSSISLQGLSLNQPLVAVIYNNKIMVKSFTLSGGRR